MNKEAVKNSNHFFTAFFDLLMIPSARGRRPLLSQGTAHRRHLYKTDVCEAAIRNSSFVNKKEYPWPQATTNQRVDLSRADTLYTVSVANALPLAGVVERRTFTIPMKHVVFFLPGFCIWALFPLTMDLPADWILPRQHLDNSPK